MKIIKIHKAIHILIQLGSPFRVVHTTLQLLNSKNSVYSPANAKLCYASFPLYCLFALSRMFSYLPLPGQVHIPYNCLGIIFMKLP